MEKQTNQTSKTKEEIFKIEEIISATSGRVVKGVDFVENYDKVSFALRNSPDYKYDDEKSLAENIYASFPQYKLKEVTEKFSALMKSWEEQDTSLINNAMNAKVMAINAGIPDKLTIKRKEKEKESVNENKLRNVDKGNKASEVKKPSIQVLTPPKISRGWLDSKHFR